MSRQKSNNDHISICICTYKRPVYLNRLLHSLKQLNTENLFSYSAVIVDNDSEKSGETEVTNFKQNTNYKIDYYYESRRSISHARNKAVKNSTGNLIAFIDDDEFPEPNWLLYMYKSLYKGENDGVLGPVKPHFDTDPPNWLVKSKILERKSFKTGVVIKDSKFTRTGNVLIKRKLFEKEDDYFDPAYGLSGGGDAVFFDRMIKKGKTFIWCDEAIVYETVPLERQSKTYHIKRSFTRGMTSAKEGTLFSLATVKSLIAVILYTISLPFLFLFAYHIYIQYLIKNCDHLSKLLAYCGIKLVKERPY